jgi:hypothetical protein
MGSTPPTYQRSARWEVWASRRSIACREYWRVRDSHLPIFSVLRQDEPHDESFHAQADGVPGPACLCFRLCQARQVIELMHQSTLST